MTNNKIITNNMKFHVIVLIIISTSFFSIGQTRQDKTDTIFRKLKLVENQKNNYEFQIETLKYQAIGNDSIKIVELEKKITDDEIVKRLNIAFSEALSDEEVDDIYLFIQSSAFEKLFNSGEINKIIASKFIDIDQKIEEITNVNIDINENQTKKFEPIPIDRENGFYATVDDKFSKTEKDIKLEEKPSITTKDILEVKKVFSSYNDRSEISIVFTNEGAKKFYLLTKENIGKPVAIVIEKHIVSLPTVTSEIMGREVSISGDFSEKEIEKMIELLLVK